MALSVPGYLFNCYLPQDAAHSQGQMMGSNYEVHNSIFNCHTHFWFSFETAVENVNIVLCLEFMTLSVSFT